MFELQATSVKNALLEFEKEKHNMNDPIVVWPPGTFYMSCSNIGPFYDCTNEYPGYAEQGYVVCCPA
jgi:hypothetical protein